MSVLILSLLPCGGDWRDDSGLSTGVNYGVASPSSLYVILELESGDLKGRRLPPPFKDDLEWAWTIHAIKEKS